MPAIPPGKKMVVYLWSGYRRMESTEKIETVRAFLSLHPNDINEEQPMHSFRGDEGE